MKGDVGWNLGIIVTCLRLYHVTSIMHCHWRKLWSRDTDVYLTYIRFGIILTHIRKMSYRYRLTPEILRFHPPFYFFFIVPLSQFFRENTNEDNQFLRRQHRYLVHTLTYKTFKVPLCIRQSIKFMKSNLHTFRTIFYTKSIFYMCVFEAKIINIFSYHNLV